MKEGLVLTYLSIQKDAIVMVKETGLQAGTHNCRSRKLAGHPHSQKQRVKRKWGYTTKPPSPPPDIRWPTSSSEVPLFKDSKISWNSTPSWGLVFKHVHLWGTFHIQATTANWTTWSCLIFFQFSCCFSLDSFYLLLCQIHAGERCHVCGCSSVINYLFTMCKALNLTSIIAKLYIIYICIFNMIFNICICNIIRIY